MANTLHWILVEQAGDIRCSCLLLKLKVEPITNEKHWLLALLLSKIRGSGIMDNNMKYGIQLAMLKKLFDYEVISKIEYDAIKTTIKRKYKIWEK